MLLNLRTCCLMRDKTASLSSIGGMWSPSRPPEWHAQVFIICLLLNGEAQAVTLVH